ncbi:0797f74f-4015-4c3d-bcc2-327d67837554 [Sclerotinia trifoliorum]|uniref:RNA polymerase II subunit A C-terminal domain phosphatase n=1 Tax=Sclerotinia trifoliorum TaxID=28548 RepID=A0A8H2ZS83_9HELO|nr:0797f74f-4015-4c3d-bcc2-327d67837554 [Sclerotinia trifoliorum]
MITKVKANFAKEDIKMGKSLSLGPNLRYPIIITKFLKKHGDQISKQDSLLEYKFKWKLMVGDPLGEQWEEEQTSYGEWDSPAEGTLEKWLIKEGTTIEKDGPVVDVEESCSHAVQFAGLCGMCGKDMTEVSWASNALDTDRARINMIHDQTHLTVSHDEASKAEEELQRRLLKNRKLSLVVDLDQTIIHACIEPTVGEWQRDVNSPNYEAVKDVRSFQLNDDGPRGLASGCWYYIKMRPGLAEFLAKISEMYELHVYTMGTRAYALSIAKIVDPGKKLFGDRIISRDENGNVTAKSLARLFPQSTHMVAIIDDRADVWPMNRPNLIKVVPYDFFTGIGDINSSFLPKREELPKVPTPRKKHHSKSETSTSEIAVETPTGEVANPTEHDGETKSTEGAKEESSSEKPILPKLNTLDDESSLQEQAAEQEKFLEQQLLDRPLLHKQEAIDEADKKQEEAEKDVEDGKMEHHTHRHGVLKDDDVELTYLQQHLTDLHRAFYEEYDKALVNVPGGRVAQLKPGHQRKVDVKNEAADLKVVPNIAVVMPRLKSRVLDGCIIVMSGLVPLGVDVMRSEIAQQIESFGGKIHKKISKRVTHVVASSQKTRTQKVREAAKYPHIKIVTQQWLTQSMSKWKKEDESDYLVDISPADRRPSGDMTNVSSPGNDSEESSDYTESDDYDDDDMKSELDGEGVMPDEPRGDISPTKDLNWSSIDDELAEFMGDDESGTESDTSFTSNNSRASRTSSRRGQKRTFDDATDEDDSEEESTMAKKQRVANSRTTSLKTVKTPTSASESSLLTPGVTGDETDEVDQLSVQESDHSFEDDLEAEMQAAFDQQLEDEAAAAAG